MSSDEKQSVSYTSYLALDEILSAQIPKSGVDGEAEHDEMLFIIIHQVYELWFKQLLHEIDFAIAQFASCNLGMVLHTLKRVRAILKTIVSQIDVLETMTPLQFSSFRDRLESSSGLQSYQFRELECVLGLKDDSVLERYESDSIGYQKIQKRLDGVTLWEGFIEFLDSRNIDVSDIQTALINIYQSDPEITQICEALTDVDEGLQEWRYRHLKMVQRTIGSKTGTGGTEGVDYLMKTLNVSLFPDLWAVRAKL